MALLLASGSAFAIPTAAQIESAMQRGNWRQADAGLAEVLQAHPDNARAHYLYAQVLDREGRYAEALAHVQRARMLDPQTRFTDPSRFAQTEARIRRDAARAGVSNTNRANNSSSTNTTTNPFLQSTPSAPPLSQSSSQSPLAAQPLRQTGHSTGPSLASWFGIALLFAAIALVLRWTVRRTRSRVDAQVGDERRQQLKRATELLNAVRSLKLDVRLSSAPGHEVLEKDVEAAEAQLRELVEALSNRANPVPPYQIDELEQQVERLKARADGRPDPAVPAAQSGASDSTAGGSVYAREADAQFGRTPSNGPNGLNGLNGPGAPYPVPQAPQAPQQQAPQQPPPVVVQQGGGFGGGMGGLLTGVLLGQVLNPGRQRPIEPDGSFGPEQNAGLDFGQGSNDWNDGGSGDIDLGSNNDSDDWGNS